MDYKQPDGSYPIERPQPGSLKYLHTMIRVSDPVETIRFFEVEANIG